MLKIIPRLTDPESYGGDARDSFDVVVPSLPGYGFSDRPTRSGMNVFRIAELWAQLMRGLGYNRFGAQGGDWGASVSTVLGLNHPENLIGLHLNYIPGSFKPFLGPQSPQSVRSRKRISRLTGRMVTNRRRLWPCSGDEATNSRLWSERFTGWTRRLDNRKVSRLERLRR